MGFDWPANWKEVPLLEKVEVTMRWHDLRHFAVSLWIEQAFSIKEIMTSPAITAGADISLGAISALFKEKGINVPKHLIPPEYKG